ncbi:N,N'-diacetylbacillosaminyl-diphospho-undecaprenol alpha-1,3-N-acetylgalactosaminyltransferase [Marivirga lumbricoides]|uniref:N, N'-diacetylbacillosaminyl-diphospho-undecaprenol alpha-1,3-N-acetylgalactosaminyltransferase n=2 Tax=Marivirga lumbricoides TaxID=1046115 RepID=A0ABQ1LSV1_9BACT|nr:N,N'-diacetylbacillosaminyl-diphospho-undecaprenol alpha-1,3-N-acetylgalactosaminyltransferase [Marivirga lumbricoides]
MQSKGYEVITASAAGPEIEEVCKREGVKHFPITFTRTLSPLQDLKALWQLIRLIKKEKPDIVHTHTPKAGLLGMMAAKYCGVKVRMHTVAGMPLMEATGATRSILKVTERLTYACASKVYPNSFQLMNYMERAFSFYENKFKIIGEGSSNGINTKHFSMEQLDSAELSELRNQLAIPGEAILFVFVGRLVEDKGIHELVEAFTALKGNAFLLLVGPFEDEREPVRLDVKEEIKSNVQIKHVGFQRDIRPYLAASDIFVFPSYREGFPNVVLQAAAMGLPAIVSDINGCNEIIQKDFNGLIVPAKESASLRRAMQQLMENESERRALAKNARPSILKYDQNLVWQKIEEEYSTSLRCSKTQGN